MASSTRKLLVTSAIWLLLVAASVFIAHPSIVNDPLIGQFAVSSTPNPFWTVHATHVPASPFLITANWGYLLGLAFVPVAALWLLVALFRQARKGTAGAVV